MVILEMDSKRIEKIVRQLRENAKSRSAFRQHYQVDKGHIFWRGAESSNEIRFQITNQHIASVIVGGLYNKDRSFINPRIEVVFEGVLKAFVLVVNMREEVRENVLIRVVVAHREKGKHLVVTAYDLKEEDVALYPKVQYVWDN